MRQGARPLSDTRRHAFGVSRSASAEGPLGLRKGRHEAAPPASARLASERLPRRAGDTSADGPYGLREGRYEAAPPATRGVDAVAA